MVRATLTSLLSHAASRIDRGVLQGIERRMRGSTPRRIDDARQRLLELARRYEGGLDATRFFLDPGVPEVAEAPVGAGPEGARVTELSFASAYRPYLDEYLDEHLSYRENLSVFARHYSKGAGRPVLVCIHGLGGGAWWLEERAFAASYWLRQGFDVALVQLPFHGRRLPAGRARGSMFPSANVIRTNEAFGQAVSDLRALRAWFEARGSVVGVMGMSLGGYTTALWTTVDDRLAFAVPWIPAVDMADLMWRHGEESPARRRAAKAGVSADLLRDVFAVHMPTGRPTLLPHPRRMIVAGKGDLITPPDQAERLWRHWDECAIHWFPGGHLAQVGRADALRAVRRHLDTLDLPGRAARA